MAKGTKMMMPAKTQIERYMDFVRPYYAGKDPAHNFQHIERIVRRLALFSENSPEEIHFEQLYFLACFHGLGKQLSNSEGFRSQVCEFLASLGWTAEEIEDGLQRLARHLIDPQSVEEKIVHDANYVEILGAFGIAKAFTTGGAKGQSLEETAEIFEHQYLDQIEFQTPAGQRLAQERKNYTKEFLSRLRDEW